jgi:hypothetical protein
MIPKSGYRFSEKIMRKQKAKSLLAIPFNFYVEVAAANWAAAPSADFGDDDRLCRDVRLCRESAGFGAAHQAALPEDNARSAQLGLCGRSERQSALVRFAAALCGDRSVRHETCAAAF